MSKRARVPGTFRPTYPKPQCKQCKEGAIRRVFSAVRGDGEKDATARVVRFMGQWVCLDHFRIQNTKKSAVELPDHLRDGDDSWSLVDLFPNRAARRRAGHHHGV